MQAESGTAVEEPHVCACKEAQLQEVDLQAVEEIVGRVGKRRRDLVGILHALHEHYRYLPQEALQKVCDITEIRPAQIVGVSTFYKQFRFTPVGEHLIRVCHGTACHVKGADFITDAFRKELKIQEGDDTDAAGKFTVEKVACLGCCSLAPCIMINGETCGRLTPESISKIVKEIQKSEAPVSAE